MQGQYRYLKEEVKSGDDAHPPLMLLFLTLELVEGLRKELDLHILHFEDEKVEDEPLEPLKQRDDHLDGYPEVTIKIHC